MKKILLVVSIVLVMVLSVSVFALAQTRLRVMWAEYDGLTPAYAADLEQAFEAAHPDIDLEIISTPWPEYHDRMITFIVGGNAPDLAVIGTRWLLELMDMGVVEPIEQWLSDELIDNIEPALMEGKIGDVLYALPVAAGTRLMYYRSDMVDKAPETFEEMLEMAQKIHDPDQGFSAIGMSGMMYTELTEHAYYLFGNDGYYFEILPDGTYGQSTVNDEAGLEAMQFMYDLANTHQVTQPGVTAYRRDELQDLFAAGNLGFFMSGGFTAGILEDRNVPFEWSVAPLPHFEGKPQSSLIVTDSIAMFNTSEAKEAAGKFLDFFYSDEWRLQFDKMIGFPPVTRSLADDPYFQTPVYQVMIEQIAGSKGWPLMEEWPQVNDIIWENISAVFLDIKTVEQGMNDAAAEIDAIRGM